MRTRSGDNVSHLSLEAIRMSSIIPLGLPIVLSAIAVFLVSMFKRQLMPWYRGHLRSLPNEAAVADALRGTEAGEYRIPFAGTIADVRSADFHERIARGPVALVSVWPGAAQLPFRRTAGTFFGVQLGYLLLISWLAGHTAHDALGLHGEHTTTWHIAHTVGLTAFAGYGFGLSQLSLLGVRGWRTWLAGFVEALVYAAITAAIFVWLWPS